MVNDVDQNDNGMIEFNEFLQMMSKKMREGDSEDELKEAFKWVVLIVKRVCYVTQSPAFLHLRPIPFTSLPCFIFLRDLS